MSTDIFDLLNKYFTNNQFLEIERHPQGIRFLKLRSMSRKEALEDLCSRNEIAITERRQNALFEEIFNNSSISESMINNYIREKFEEERANRVNNEEYLIDQLNRLQSFDWGGSHGNSLEKNIVNNYVKKTQSFDQINEHIEGPLLRSLKGYTLNSWYNHWTSILIEDIFKTNPKVLPTVGLVTKIDFFIDNIPFDLKVTYFPEELMKEKLKTIGYGNELTETKKICRNLGISIPSDLKDMELKIHLQNKLKECVDRRAKNFLIELKQKKLQIINSIKDNPNDLKVWLYENQGEMRFDASNRFFLILVNELDLSESWKLKRNIPFLRREINNHLKTISENINQLNTSFYWEKTDALYECKSDVLFINYNGT